MFDLLYFWLYSTGWVSTGLEVGGGSEKRKRVGEMDIQTLRKDIHVNLIINPRKIHLLAVLYPRADDKRIVDYSRGRIMASENGLRSTPKHVTPNMNQHCACRHF